MIFRTRPPVLSLQEMQRAAELYVEGKSRRQVAAILRCSEAAVVTALRVFDVPLRPQPEASAKHNQARVGFYRKSQLVASVFDLSR